MDSVTAELMASIFVCSRVNPGRCTSECTYVTLFLVPFVHSFVLGSFSPRNTTPEITLPSTHQSF